MKECDVIDLPDGRRGTVVYVFSDAQRIIVEVGSDLIDYVIEDKRLREISRMTVSSEDLVSRLIDAKQAADRGETIDVTDWTREQIAKRLFYVTTGMSRSSSRSLPQRVSRPLLTMWTAPRRETTMLTGLR
jgi:hypothetical protein